MESSQQPREGDTADFNEQQTLRETLRADLDANQFGGKLSGIFTAAIVCVFAFLPIANKAAGRLCFHSCPSEHEAHSCDHYP